MRGRGRHRHGAYRYGLHGVTVAAAAWLAAGVPEGAAQQPAVVEVDAVRVEAPVQTVPIIGRLVARQAGEVAARTGGPVAALRVDVGDRVTKGDIIAVLDTVRLRAERDRLTAIVDEAEARIEQATAQAVLRGQELHRLERLRDSAAFSQSRFEDARQEVTIAERAIGQAKAVRASAAANLALAEIDLAWATIEAPYPGAITILHTQVGAWLSIGDAVATMVNDVDLEVEADVPSNRVEALDTGAVVSIALDDGTGHMAVVRAVVPEENVFTRTRQVRFTPRFGPLGKPLAINQSVTVDLPARRDHEVLTVHKDAIVRDGGQTFVYVASDGRAQIRLVRLGGSVGGRFEVLKGLGPGEPVVVRGNERLRPDQPITVGDSG